MADPISTKSDSSNIIVGSDRSTLRSWDPFIDFYTHRYLPDIAKLQEKRADAGGGVAYADLCFGNPSKPPLRGLVAALRRQLPESADEADPSTFAYDPRVREGINAVVDALWRTRQMKVDPQDVSLTNGALSGLSLALQVLANPGDEAIIVTPSYWFYPSMIEYAGLTMVKVAANSEKGFDLDVESIRRAISPKTGVILLNSPNNPTGKIYSLETLRVLASMLEVENEKRRARSMADAGNSAAFRPIIVVSDEAYNRIVFDDIQYQSIAEVYAYSMMVYTWGKTLLAPSERFGYIAPSPLMPEESRSVLRDRFFRAQLLGWFYPNNTTARAYAEVEAANLTIDVAEMEARRDRIYSALTGNGWNVTRPEGSFYMLVQVPTDLFEDESELLDALREENVFAVPGSIMDISGWIRLSLTASDEIAEFALDAFRRISMSKRRALA